MNGHYNAGDTVLGNWRLTHLIGEGSYGRVFAAEREDYGTVYTAAIKIITIPQSESEIKSARAEGMSDESVTEYFRSMIEDIVREFALMSKLKGTANIVSYEDHTVEQHSSGIGWDIIIRMERLTPLLDYAIDHPLTQADIIKLAIDMCRALELCQKFNIIHRDIKPENMFVSNLNDYKLGDFGIARTVERTTSALSKRGTFTYMAPEAYRDGTFSPSIDIYSLGIVLYRMLNDNRVPFLPEYPAPITHSDREAALAKRINGEAFPRPKNADARLAEIILKACAYNPKDRYQNPTLMRNELETILYIHNNVPLRSPQSNRTLINPFAIIEKSIEKIREKSSAMPESNVYTTVESASGTDSCFEPEDDAYNVNGDDKTVLLFDGEFNSPEPSDAATKSPPFRLFELLKKKEYHLPLIAAGVVVLAVTLIIIVTLPKNNADSEIDPATIAADMPADENDSLSAEPTPTPTPTPTPSPSPSPEPSPVYFTSFFEPEPITGIRNGANKTAEALKLPETIRIMVTRDGEEIETDVKVSWNVDECDYNPKTTKRQTFTVNGKIELPFYILNDDDTALEVSVSVTVNQRASSSTPTPKPETHHYYHYCTTAGAVAANSFKDSTYNEISRKTKLTSAASGGGMRSAWTGGGACANCKKDIWYFLRTEKD